MMEIEKKCLQSDSSEEGGRQEIQVACFRVGEEVYGLDIMRIKEIVRAQKLTPMPKAPSFVGGVINLRGVVIPVVLLRRRFGLSDIESGKSSRIIICAVAKKIVGLLVDEVTEVCRFTRPEVLPAPQFLAGKGAEYFFGVCRREEDLVMLLDLERILSGEEKIELGHISQG